MVCHYGNPSTVIRNTRLGESQAGIRIAGTNISNLRYADDTTLMAGSEEELKSLLMGGSETQHQKSKIMAFGPIISWQIEAEKVEAVTDFNRSRKSRSSDIFYLLGLQNHCGHSKISW